MKIGCRRLFRWVAGFCLAILFVSVCRAHDIPNERVDRAIQVTLSAGELAVDYEVSLAELTLAQDLRRLVGRVQGADREQLFHHYGEVAGPLNAKGFLITLDGREVV